jgi:DNA-binding response OmpR family regulator
MTDLLQPAVGRGQADLPRQARRRTIGSITRRLLVLLAGDEAELGRLRQSWSGQAIDVDRCGHLAAALVLVGKSSPDLVVIGETRGPLDAGDFLRALRQVDRATFVVVGLVDMHVDLASDLLAAGASAVVRRPFAPAELLGLLPAGIWTSPPAGPVPQPLDLGRLKVDITLPRIWLDGGEVLLPRMEFRLLRQLAEHVGEVVPRAELQSAAWGDVAAARSNSLAVHMGRLRRRLQAGSGVEWICSIRGFGYRLVVPAAAGQPSSATQE